jgi:hypothetical protein
MTCRDIPGLKDHLRLMREVGYTGISDEESDPDYKPTPQSAPSPPRLVRLRPIFRSDGYETFMRVLDAIREARHGSNRVILDPEERLSLAASKPIIRDFQTGFSRRKTPTGKPRQLYSEAYLKELADDWGKDLRPTDQFRDLRVPPVLPDTILENLKELLTEDVLRTMRRRRPNNTELQPPQQPTTSQTSSPTPSNGASTCEITESMASLST